MTSLGGLLSPPTRLRVWLRVAVVLGLCISGWAAWHTHITDCGFDANGAYAEVRANPLGVQEVWVDFYLDGTQYTYAGAYNVRGTKVLRAPFPDEDNHVSGRTVYVDTHHHGPVTFVTREFAEAHPGRTRTEVVPAAGHTLSCRFDHTDPD
jgi:hypothetical protein